MVQFVSTAYMAGFVIGAVSSGAVSDRWIPAVHLRVGLLSCVLDHEICFDLKMHCNAFDGLVLLDPLWNFQRFPDPQLN